MEPKFVIQGVDYPVPEWVSFTMDESVILYEKAGMTLDQADDDIVFTPGLLAALMLIAYMRGNPGVSRKAGEKIIGSIPMVDAIEHLAGEPEDDDVGPPSQTPSETEPLGEPARNDESTPSSGDVGENGSVTQDESHLVTGMPVSATPPISDPVTSAT